jgi:predicted ATPase/class 3 adenylate cyclase
MTADPSTSFGDLLRRARQSAGLTQEELAERAGLSRRGIADLESGARKTPRKDTVALLAAALELSEEERTAFAAAARRSVGQATPAASAVSPLSTDPGESTAPVVALPSGTVTFLVSDIEGSTRLLQGLGRNRYATLLAEHRELLRAALAAQGGHAVDSQGESSFTVFPTAGQAVTAAVAVQRALAAHAWPAEVTVRVRMGLHSGTAQVAGDRYIGLDVHRAARIAAAGHGGQVLLSQTTCDLVENDLPVGVILRVLGPHRLKDLQRPEELAQLVLPDLPADFPPLDALDRHRHNLPIQLTALLGREREVAAVCTLLRRDDLRLLTLTGPGGVGKTRLGLQVAAELASEYADGAWFVDLSRLTNTALVPQSIAQAIGLRENGDQTIEEALQEYVRPRQILFVLDNFEHLAVAAPQVAALLATSPAVKALVTSRVALHVRGEHEYLVPPLALPASQRLPAPERLTDYAAMALFVQRAQEIRPDFELSPETAPAVAEICRRLDGLPLAIELAAARIKVLPPPALLQRLERRLPLLSGGARDLPERQQTMRNTLAWSYDLLQPAEQRLFRRFAVFVGGWTLEAAEAVCVVSEGAEPLRPYLVPDPLDALGTLAEQSLIQEEGGEPRFGMLQVIREYALERLEAGSDDGREANEAVALRQAHAGYYLGLAEHAEPELQGPAQSAWLDRLERDHDNFRAALAWTLEEGGAGDLARLALALWPFWHARLYLREGQRWLEQVLALADCTPVAPALRARVLNALGVIAHTLGRFEQADGWHGEAIRMWRELGDRDGLAVALLDRGWQRFYQLRLEEARACADESLALARQVGNRRAIAAALYLRAVPVTLSLFVDSGSLPPPLMQHPEMVISDAEECLHIWRELGDTTSVASALSVLACCELSAGHYERAKSLLAEALASDVQTGDVGRLRAPTVLGLFLVAIHAQDQPRGGVQAAQLLGAMYAWGESQEGRISPLSRGRGEQFGALATDVVGEEVFAREFAAGKRLPQDVTIALAMAIVQPVPDSKETLPSAETATTQTI